MAGNSFGTLFKLSTFGESHGPAIGGVIDGCPAGLSIDPGFIQHQLDRRKPGMSRLSSTRKESDTVQILSGVFEGKTTGAPIGLLIPNEDARSADYSHLKDAFRPSHADFSWQSKYGIRDYRGGGRSSARETAVRVAAGAIAQLLLREKGISVQAYVSAVGEEQMKSDAGQLDLSRTDEFEVRCPDPAAAAVFTELIETARKAGDSLGGVISCVIAGSPAGLGEPVFDKLHADLGKAMLSINAVKGFELGSGFAGSRMRGSEHNDLFHTEEGRIRTRSNHSGGIQGGISNGEAILFRVAFKPVATIMQDQESIDAAGNPITLSGKGRHDPCVLPRAVPIVEAMAALVMADHLLRSRSNQL